MSSMHTSQPKSTHGMSDSDTSRSTTHEIKHDLKKDVAAVRDDLGHLKDDAIKAAAHTKEQAAEALRHGKESATEMARSATESCKQYHQSMCDSVKKNPTTAVLLAIGVGVIAGRLLPRR
jgi:ElaB/YqjD/DUF883 family membrane-anchored ribosome-binding protein